MRLNTIRVRGLDPYIEESYIDLNSIPGDLVAVTGGNGAGKSTLLNFFPAATVALNKKFLKMPKPDGRALSELSVAKDSFLEVGFEFGQSYTVRHSINGPSGKTECSVTNGTGESLLKGKSGVSEYLAWAVENTLPPEVFFGSVFSSQRTRGMMGMDPAERKAIVLRVIGLERYEQLAEVARKKRTECDRQLAVASGKLQELTGDTVAFCEQNILRLTDEKRLADETLRLGELTLEDLRGKNAAIEKQRAEYDALVARRRELESQEQKLKARLAELDQLITNCQTVLADKATIESAAEDVKNLTSALADLKAGESELRVQQSEAQARAREKRQELQRLNEKLAGLNQGIANANKVLADKDRIASAAGSVAELQATLKAVQTERDEAFQEYERLQGAATATGDTSRKFLRGELRYIADGKANNPVAYAGGALSADDLTAKEIAERPQQILTVKAKWQQAGQRAQGISEQISVLTRLADRTSAVKDAERIVEEAEREIRELRSLNEELSVEIRAAELAVTDIEAALTSKIVIGATTQKEIERLAPIAAKVSRITEATLKIGVRREERETVDAEHSKVLADMVALSGETVEPLPLIPLSDHELAVSQARTAASRAAAALSIAQEALTRATVREARRAELQQEVETFGRDTADWKRLADDLGRDGIQALCIDASAPELTTLANELLRASGDTRFSLKISTTRMDSTGKREIEGFVIEITDSRKPGTKTGASGGEESYINKALSFAVTKMACRHAGLTNPTIIDDEGDAALDIEYSPHYISMLRHAMKLMGAPKGLFVSHRPDSWNLADARLIIADGQISIT